MDVIYWSAPGKKCSDKSQVTRDKKVALETLQRVLDETTGHLYKIGFAKNPQSRGYFHEGFEVDRYEEGSMVYITLQRGFWASMHVIYQTSSAVQIRLAEKEFIGLAVRKYGGGPVEHQRPGQTMIPLNDNAGGGGPVSPTGLYFIYVLRSRG
jgi:hypothetical protein